MQFGRKGRAGIKFLREDCCALLTNNVKHYILESRKRRNLCSDFLLFIIVVALAANRFAIPKSYFVNREKFKNSGFKLFKNQLSYSKRCCVAVFIFEKKENF